MLNSPKSLANDLVKPARGMVQKLVAGSQLVLGDEKIGYESVSAASFQPYSANNSESKADNTSVQSGRMQPASNILLGRENNDWGTSSISARSEEQLKNHKLAVLRGAALENAYASHVVLGDQELDYVSVSRKDFIQQ